SALPAQSSSEPSLMKPLVALLCNSMDGFVSAEICYFLGEIYLNLKSWKKAAAALTSALQMDTSGKIANWIFSEFNRLFFEDMVYKGASNAYDALGTILLKLKLLRDLEPYSTQSLILDVVLRLQRVGYSCQLAELVPIGTDLEIYQRASEALLSYMALTDTPVEEVMATLTNSSKFALFTLKTAHLIRLCAANPSLSAKMLPLIQESFIAPPFQLTLLHHSTFSHHDRDVAAIYFLEHWEPPTPLILHLDATQLAFSEGVWKLLQKAALHVEELYVTSNQQQEHFSAFLKACTNLKVLSSTIELPLDALNCFPKLERLITATCYYVSTEFLATISSMQLRQLSISCDYDEIHPGFVATLARNPISILELNSRLTPSLLPTLLSGAPNLRTSLRRLLLTCTDTDPALEQVTQFQGLEILTLASYSSCLRMSGDISVLRSLPHLDSLVINACPLPSGADLRGGVACRSLEINGTNTACDDAAWKEMVVNSPSLRVFKSTVVFRTEFFSFITRSLPCLQELSIVTADLDHTNTPFELCAIPTLEKLSFVGEMCTDLSVWPTLFPNLRCLSLCRPRYTSPTADFSFFGKLLHLEDLSLDMRSISTTQVYQLTTSPPPLKRLSFTIPEITVDELEAQLIVDNFNLDYFRVERLTIRAREILVARIPTVESHFAFADSSLFPLSQAPSCIG
ncbi:MAG: hypothetical protein Q8P67_05750, partial [archaeon]|nr:hypothetical protein [archaeon]